MITQEQIENWFTYHPPRPGAVDGNGKLGPGDQERYQLLRLKAKELALIIIECTPASADQTTAIRKLRECIMTANAAIACDGK